MSQANISSAVPETRAPAERDSRRLPSYQKPRLFLVGTAIRLLQGRIIGNSRDRQGRVWFQ